MAGLEKGIVYKAYGGFYFVGLDDGRVLRCRLRGRYRLGGQQACLPGERVVVLPTDGSEGVIEEVLPRDNQLTRPAVANVDRVIAVVALERPAPDMVLLDRMLVNCAYGGLEAVVCFNKEDLAPPEVGQGLGRLYEGIGYRALVTSAKNGRGVADLAGVLAHGVSVFAGPSGVGKSSLLNSVQSGLSLRTGEVSQRTQRGRHTTRAVELLPLEQGGLVADSPGFSTMWLPEGLRPEELPACFPEFDALNGACRFRRCLHHKEPDCAVKDAVGSGLVNRRRYQNYLRFLEEISSAGREY